MIRIDSEWDFGYGDTVFESREKALTALRNDPNVKELADDRNTTLDGLIAEGLISFQSVLLG